MSYSTLAFRRLRDELTVLSDMRWAIVFAQEAVVERARETGASGSNKLSSISAPGGFDFSSFDEKLDDFTLASKARLEHLNLLLLVKAVASAEDYLHCIARCWAVANGYFSAARKGLLDERGHALLSPALVSDIFEVLKYLKVLMGFELCDEKLRRIQLAYRLRCVAAHTGGIVDASAAMKIPAISAQLGKRLHIEWTELQDLLVTIQACCATVEASMRDRIRIRGEARLALGEMIRNGDLSAKTEPTLRKALTDKVGFERLPDRATLESWIKESMPYFGAKIKARGAEQ